MAATSIILLSFQPHNKATRSTYLNPPLTFYPMLDNRYALLFIRGERPILDEKYDILKHPNVALSADGKANPYEHGKTDNAVASISFAGVPAADMPKTELPETDYELLSDEDIEALFL